MRTHTFLFASVLLLASHALPAQQQARRTAAETLEMELAKKTAGIAPAPPDENKPGSGKADQAAAAAAAEPSANPPAIRTGKDEKMAARPDPSRRIPEPPQDESQPPPVQQALPPAPPPAGDAAAQQKPAEKSKPPANPDELEAQQHKRNGIRPIPAPPKAEPASNQD